MSQTVKTILICMIFSVLTLAGSAFIINKKNIEIDHLKDFLFNRYTRVIEINTGIYDELIKLKNNQSECSVKKNGDIQIIKK